jgi:hypothetical protein
MSCVRWPGSSWPLCRINKLRPAERTFGSLFCFPEPFIEAFFVKNMVARERANTISIFDMLQAYRTKHHLVKNSQRRGLIDVGR